MEIEEYEAKIEAILFAAGREVKIQEFMLSFELEREALERILKSMQDKYYAKNRGIELIQVGDAYQLCSKKEYYEDIYPILDKRNKPKLSTAALETISIIAYNPKITRAEIESIRGVSSDASIYKLLEYGLIEEAGRLDAPGRPTTYQTTDEFLRMFGYKSLDDLPDLPRYKLDENKQIVIDELIEEEKGKAEAPMPEREEEELNQENKEIK